MSSPKGQIRLGAFLPAFGHHAAAWRHPGSPRSAGLDFNHYKRLAQIAEQAKFDMIFLADGVAVRREGDSDALSRTGHLDHFEPLTLLSALSAVTAHVGLTATVSTTYNEPYHLARKLASLDYLSNGRAGWNVVTSASDAEAYNFNRDNQLDHRVRYERASEFLTVAKGLWDSWDDDAFLRDKESGIYVDAAKLHVLHHKGEHFAVRGPLNVARPIQGYPVIIQAGASEDGQEFAASTAEVIFTAWRTIDEARAFYKNIKSRLPKYGRAPEHFKIMPGIYPVIGQTESEAKEKYDQLSELLHPSVGLALLSSLSGGIDLSQFPVDGPLPELPPTNGNQSRRQLMADLAGRENLTIRQLYTAVAGARGHWTLWGTPEQIADQMEEWFVTDAADGFNVMPPYLPEGLITFAETVVPILQSRGLFRTEYEGRTLRENLGLPRPVNQFSVTSAAAQVGR